MLPVAKGKQNLACPPPLSRQHIITKLNIFLLTCCVLELVNGFPNQTYWDTWPDQAGIGISDSAAFLIQELEMLSKEIL